MKKTCMLIPGNPAVADYYDSWIEELKKVNPNLDITYATSYVLHDKKLNCVEYDFEMRKHYEDLFLMLDRSVMITIIAHSVGSYFALQLLEKYPERIEKVIMLFPYIGYSAIPSLKFLPLLYQLDRFLPLVEIFSKLKIGGDHDISSYELRCCLRFGARQCVYFGKHKFNTQVIAASKDKLYFIYTEGDRWCPVETIELLKPVSHYTKVNLPHNFIINKAHRLAMIKELGISQFL